MATIKPLEKNNPGIVIKLVFLSSLIITGLLLNKILVGKLKVKSDILGEAKRLKNNTQDQLINEVQNSDFIASTIKQGEEISENILGEATQLVSNTATAASEMVRDIVFDSTVGNILKQVDKLPAWEQDKVREQICK